MLVDRDEAEAARRERIAEHGIDACIDPRRTAADLAQHQVADLGILQLADGEFATLFLVDGRQPEALALAPDDAQRQLGRALELLHGMGDETFALLLGPAQQPVADAERAAPPAL